jgi:hypothetical protein
VRAVSISVEAPGVTPAQPGSPTNLENSGVFAVSGLGIVNHQTMLRHLL